MRSIVIVVTFMVSLFCIIGCRSVSNQSNGDERLNTVVENTSIVCLEDYVTDAMVVYDVKRDDFIMFIGNPTVKALDSDKSGISYYRRSETHGNIEQFGVDLKIQTLPEGVFRIGANVALPVYGSLIDFVGNADLISEFLLDKGISGEVQNHVAIYSEEYPFTIWVEVAQQHYFITVDEYFDDHYNREEDNYVYRIYSQNEYINKIAPEVMPISINNKNLSDLSAKLYGNLVEIPLISILNTLDCEVHWNEDKTELELILNGERYALRPAQHSLIKIGGDYNYIMTPPGGVSMCNVHEGEVYVDEYALVDILELIGADVQIDYDAMRIVIE